MIFDDTYLRPSLWQAAVPGDIRSIILGQGIIFGLLNCLERSEYHCLSDMKKRKKILSEFRRHGACQTVHFVFNLACVSTGKLCYLLDV